ncbi:unnamed protein product [Polarella glacialis]|uniref:Phosphoribosyltransferase domain-containing protein n=1 Tax=Polarella glacialis TaxID=89957 RepID=A0A813D9D8_POLGL|nr:unnamed protein product [Polarella glacialis]
MVFLLLLFEAKAVCFAHLLWCLTHANNQTTTTNKQQTNNKQQQQPKQTTNNKQQQTNNKQTNKLSQANADVIIPWADDNRVAVDLITQHIRSKISIQVWPTLTATLLLSDMHLDSFVTAIHMIAALCAVAIPKEINGHAFDAFAYISAETLARLAELSVRQSGIFSLSKGTGSFAVPITGHMSSWWCGVSIIRSGEAMENALRQCCSAIKIGKILIHRSGDSGSALAYEKMPYDISQRQVFLMDPIVATGLGTLPVSLIVLTSGKRVITSEIDRCAAEDGTLRPGIGDFGDRYFGTLNSSEENADALVLVLLWLLLLLLLLLLLVVVVVVLALLYSALSWHHPG